MAVMAIPQRSRTSDCGIRDHARPALVRADVRAVGTVPILLDGTDLPPCDRPRRRCPPHPRTTHRHGHADCRRPRAPTFTTYHRVLNRNRWSSREVARRLLTSLIGAFMPTGPVVIGLDDTLERRWGARIKARGIYRDPIRSSHGHFVKAS